MEWFDNFRKKHARKDFVKLAESYGIPALRVERVEDIKSAVDKAFSVKGAFIIDFVVEPKELL